jgi:hypothetical protein
MRKPAATRGEAACCRLRLLAQPRGLAAALVEAPKLGHACRSARQQAGYDERLQASAFRVCDANCIAHHLDVRWVATTSSAYRLGSGEGEGWTLNIRQIASEPLPAFVLVSPWLFVCDAHIGSYMDGIVTERFTKSRVMGSTLNPKAAKTDFAAA